MEIRRLDVSPRTDIFCSVTFGEPLNPSERQIFSYYSAMQTKVAIPSQWLCEWVNLAGDRHMSRKNED